MSERKVLNKYYPPDFDPSKIPKLKLPKDRQYVVRLMAPFNMRLAGEFWELKPTHLKATKIGNLYKSEIPLMHHNKISRTIKPTNLKFGTFQAALNSLTGHQPDEYRWMLVQDLRRVHLQGQKFNARKETVQNESYLGLPIFRFYIKCTRCLAEITFKTDPENTDYAMEHGATRNFQAEKLLEEEEKRLQKEREDEELNNPMKVLENRTKDSKLEMEVLENLQELKELNQRQANVDFESMLHQYKEFEEQQKQRELEEDEQEMKSMLEQAQSRRLLEDSDSEEDLPPVCPKPLAKGKPTDILQQDSEPQAKKSKLESWERSVGKLSMKTQLSGLVAAKKKPISGMANGSGSQEATSEPGGREQHSPGASTATLPSSNTGITSLGLLGAYSDSDDSKSD